MYVCIYIYIYVCVFIHIYVYICVCIYRQLYTYTYIGFDRYLRASCLINTPSSTMRLVVFMII